MEIICRTGAALACALTVGACGGGGANDPPPPPVVVSLSTPSPAEVAENENPMVEVTVSAGSAVSAGLTVPLTFSGTATRGQDYAADGDSVVIPAGSASASMTLDVYRDFDAEGDETITVSLGAITGNAQAARLHPPPGRFSTGKQRPLTRRRWRRTAKGAWRWSATS